MSLQLELDDIKKALNATKLALVQSNVVEKDEDKKLVNAATLIELNDQLNDLKARYSEVLNKIQIDQVQGISVQHSPIHLSCHRFD